MNAIRARIELDRSRKQNFLPSRHRAMVLIVKTLQVELPDQMAREVEHVVAGGAFLDEAEVVRVALREFITSRRFELIEQQQLEDVAWALGKKANG